MKGSRLAATITGALIVSCIGIVLLHFAYTKLRADELEPRSLPPLYHNAQEAEERFTWDKNIHVRTLTFTTSDRAEIVKKYYEGVMQKLGWRFAGYPFPDNPDRAWFDHSPDDGPTYKVLITTKASSQGQTDVELEMYALGLDWWGK
jgi:hypothetical protein